MASGATTNTVNYTVIECSWRAWLEQETSSLQPSQVVVCKASWKGQPLESSFASEPGILGVNRGAAEPVPEQVASVVRVLRGAFVVHAVVARTAVNEVEQPQWVKRQVHVGVSVRAAHLTEADPHPERRDVHALDVGQDNRARNQRKEDVEQKLHRMRDLTDQGKRRIVLWFRGGVRQRSHGDTIAATGYYIPCGASSALFCTC